MRILLVIDSLDVGGAERHVVDLARGLRARGDDVVVACSAGGPLRAELDEAGVPVVVLAPRRVKRRVGAAYAWRLARLMRSGGFDLVHAHLYASAAAAALATVVTRTPLVVTEQTEGPWRGRLAMRVSCLTYRRACRVIAVSRAIAGRLAECGVPEEKVLVVPNTVQPLPRAPLRDPGDAPLVGAIARLVPEKGLDVLLAAAGEVCESTGARFVIAGDGPLHGALGRRARELGVQDRVQFAGECDDVPALLRELDVLAVPSRAEGTPLTIVEAMWAGVPIVATTAGGIPEQLRDGRDALLVEPGDAAALAAALLRVAADRELRDALVASARRRAEERFRPEAMVRRIAGVYGEATAAPAPAAVPELARATAST